MEGWFDGACEPVNPGGVATWAYVVRDGGRAGAKGPPRASGEGLVEGPPASRTSNVAEYWGLAHLLQRILAEGWQAEPWVLHGDSRLVVKQASGEWQAHRPHLAALRTHVHALLAQVPGARLVQVPREANAEADAGTHRAYEAALDADAGLRANLAAHFASDGLVRKCRSLGIPTYRYMGKSECIRLLAKEAQRRKAEAGG